MAHILVIDDNEATCNLICHICKHIGASVTTTLNAQEGIALAYQLNPCMIFADLQLPGEINGWQIIQTLRSDPQLKDKPIIAISAGNHQRTAIEAGSSAFIQKPFSAQTIMDCIRKYVAVPSH
jgi:CheY-like chemotaxis protein